MELWILCRVCNGEGRTYGIHGGREPWFCPGCDGRGFVPITPNLCQHEFRWIEEGPEAGSSAVRECRYCEQKADVTP